MLVLEMTLTKGHRKGARVSQEKGGGVVSSKRKGGHHHVLPSVFFVQGQTNKGWLNNSFIFHRSGDLYKKKSHIGRHQSRKTEDVFN